MEKNKQLKKRFKEQETVSSIMTQLKEQAFEVKTTANQHSFNATLSKAATKCPALKTACGAACAPTVEQ